MIAAGSLLTAFHLLLLRNTFFFPASVYRFFVIFFLMAGTLAALIVITHRQTESTGEGIGPISDAKFFLFVIGFATLWRILYLSTPPIFSDDIYRYLWDGTIMHAGLNPYLLPPDHWALAEYQSLPFFDKINHREISTIYPPFSQYVFYFITFFSTSPLIFRAVFIFCDLLTIVIIWKLLRTLRFPRWGLLIYAWHPLVILETAGSGHQDIMGILLLMLSLYGLATGRRYVSGLCITLSSLIKYNAVLLIPFIGIGRFRKVIPFSVLLFGIFFFSFYDPEWHILDGFTVYLGIWQAWGFIYNICINIFLAWGDLDPRWKVKLILGGFLLVYGLVLWIRCYRNPNNPVSILRSIFLLTGAALLLSPTLHPWYLLWIIPFLCFFPNRAWILLTFLFVLTYQTGAVYRMTGVWHESSVTYAILYIPFYILLIWDWVKVKILH